MEEIDENPCEVDGKISMEQFRDVGCPAMGRFVNLSIVLVFADETMVQLQVASKDFASSQCTMTEVAKLVPQLMSHGLVSCRFVSNQNEQKFFPDLPIESNTIKLLAKTNGLHIIFEYFALNETPQEHLNTTCNVRLTFSDCTFNGRGALLLSTPDIPLKIAFKGQHNLCFPELVHLVAALEHGFLEDLSMEILMEAYKLKGPQDCNNLKRFCTAAVCLGHKVVWGDNNRTRFGSFAKMPDHEPETINMGLFGMNNLGSAGT